MSTSDIETITRRLDRLEQRQADFETETIKAVRQMREAQHAQLEIIRGVAMEIEQMGTWMTECFANNMTQVVRLLDGQEDLSQLDRLQSRLASTNVALEAQSVRNDPEAITTIEMLTARKARLLAEIEILCHNIEQRIDTQREAVRSMVAPTQSLGSRQLAEPSPSLPIPALPVPTQSSDGAMLAARPCISNASDPSTMHPSRLGRLCQTLVTVLSTINIAYTKTNLRHSLIRLLSQFFHPSPFIQFRHIYIISILPIHTSNFAGRSEDEKGVG
jgi:hypothetical protein